MKEFNGKVAHLKRLSEDLNKLTSIEGIDVSDLIRETSERIDEVTEGLSEQIKKKVISDFVDKEFEDNPATDVVNEGIQVLLDGHEVKKEKRTTEVEERINEYENGDRLEQQVNYLISSYDFSEETDTYKQGFKNSLITAINMVIDTNKRCKFGVKIGGELVEGSIFKIENGVNVVVDGEEYLITVNEKETTDADHYCDGDCDIEEGCCEDCCDYPYCSCEMVEDYSCGEDCGCCVEEGVDKHLDTGSEEHHVNPFIQDVMESIEEELGDKEELTASDIRLVRFYLIHLLNDKEGTIENTDDDIIELAWKNREYYKK